MGDSGGTLRGMATYEAIRAELGTTIGWFERILGRSVKGSRLEAITTSLDEILLILNDRARREQLPELIEATTFYYTILDASGFNKICRRFQNLPDHRMPRALLRRAIQGPLSPAAESVRDSDARNIFAQLEFAANVMQKGFDPLGFEDLSFKHKGFIYHVEAKRLWSDSAEAITRNVARANEQIEIALAATPGKRARGLVLLVLDRVAGLSSVAPSLLPAYSQTDVRRHANQLAVDFLDCYQSALADLSPQVPGVVLVARFPFRSVPENVFGQAYIPVLKLLVQEGTRDYARLRRLAEALSSRN